MYKQTTDVLVIGGALAGLMSALAAREHTERVLVVSKAPAGKCGNTLISAGMIAAAIGRDDSPQLFYDNLLESGKGLIDEQLAHKLAFNSKAVFDKLVEFGVKFVKDAEGFKVNLAPGHNAARNIQAALGNIPVQNAGLAFMLPLLQACKDQGVQISDGYTLVQLLKQGDRISGALFRDRTGGYLQVAAKTVVIATGGYSKLFGVTNNTADITADGIAAAFSIGCKLQDMEQAQFFPCMMFKPLKLIPNNILFGRGSRLKNKDGEYFMTNYDPAGDMATRDIMARSIYYEVQAGRGIADDSVYFDCTPIEHSVWTDEFPGFYKLFKNKGVDLTKEAFPVKPCAHYSLGGIMVDDNCQTNISGLYVGGEAMASVHGANRLAGAGLLEAALFGWESGRNAALAALELPTMQMDDCAPAPVYTPEPELEVELGRIMWSSCSLIRTADVMQTALADLDTLQAKTSSEQFIGRINLCRAILKSALLRTESRGAHYRLDYPQPDPTQAKHIVTKMVDGQVVAAFKG